MAKFIKILIAIAIVGALIVVWVMNPGDIQSKILSTGAQVEYKAKKMVKTKQITQKDINDAKVCRENLRRIQIAKRKAEQRKGAMQKLTWADVLPYLNNTMPVCPAGGHYSLNPPVQVPSCSIGGRGTISLKDDHMILN